MERLSGIYGKRIYNEGSGFVGTAHDVLIDPEEGKIKFLLKQEATSILGRERTEAKKFIKENFIPFERVSASGDIILVRD